MNSTEQRSGSSPQASSAIGRNQPSFAKQSDIDEFVATLERYERGEINAEDWRSFRLVRGVYGQRQDDVQMFRIKIPQGILSAQALNAAADACERYSRGFAHITTRQNIQMHFVKLSDTPAIMNDLAAAGITTREACGHSVRNIVGCPMAGVCPEELFDVTPYADATTRYFLRHPLASSLPRKFKIAFSGCGPDCVGTGFNDIGFRAEIRGINGKAERGFRITAGGGTATLCQAGDVLYDFVPAGEILSVAEAILRVFHQHGNRRSKANARMKYLIRKIGWDNFKKLYYEEFAEFIAQGGASLPFDPQHPPVETAPAWDRPAAPAVVEVAQRAASAKMKGPGIVPPIPRAMPELFSAEDYEAFCRTNVMPQRQDGYAAVTIHLPMGDLSGQQFRIVADLALAYGDGSVRTTARQNLLMRWVKRDDVSELYRRLRAAGLGPSGAETIADVTSCPGAESCRLAVTQSRGLGRELTEYFAAHPELATIAPEATIKISGCPNGCAQHHVSTFGFQGGLHRLEGNRLIPQYQLFIGGEVDGGETHFGRRSVKLPARRVTEAMERLLLWYRDSHAANETAIKFFRRADLKEIESRLADLCEIVPASVRPEDFIDIGEDHAFAPETKEGECAA
ncbi:MAG TPA: nitrite/sulfite reductase [Candidatus Binataceae bacterium]|nr:nitrite/sulfite reductase [Candidatus Binataceae bacterium]